MTPALCGVFRGSFLRGINRFKTTISPAMPQAGQHTGIASGLPRYAENTAWMCLINRSAIGVKLWYLFQIRYILISRSG